MTALPDKTIKTALKRFKLAAEAEKDIRKKSLEDLKFRAGEQWPDDVAVSRNNSKRPCLSINRLPQFIRQVTNDQRQNRPQIRVDPVGNSSVETALIIEGLMRHIQVASNADIAYDTACDNQVTMGFGYIRIVTEYCDENSFDQDIRIKRVKNPFTVYFDPNAIEPDYSDAKWAFVVSDVSKEDFERDYPSATVLSNEDLNSIGDDAANWRAGDDIRIAEYFEVVEKPATLYMLADGTSTFDKPAPDSGVQVLKERDSTKRTVVYRKITAMEVLEEKDWIGKWIPIVPVLGEDLDIDGKRELIGMVRYARDPQRMYNYWASAQTEAIALAPKAPFMIAEGQIEGYEKFWSNANTENFSHLPYKPTAVNGALVPMPSRQQAEPPVQAMIGALMQADRDLMNTTGIYQAGLGQKSNETSGRAITARQHEGDVANFHYVDNLSRSMKFVGVIIEDLRPKIYDAARTIRIIHPDGEAEMVAINQLTEHKGQSANYDLAGGKYDIVINTGPSFSTMRQEASASMIQMTQANPELWKVIGDLMVKNMDWPGAQDMAARLKLMLPPQLQEKDGQHPLPPDVQQKMQQMQQMIEQMTGALHQAHDELDDKKMELESKERIAAENNLAKIVIAEMQNNQAAFQAELKHISDRMALLHSNLPINGEEQGEQPQPIDNGLQSDTMNSQPAGGEPAAQ